MSKDLRKDAERLEREADRQVEEIRRAVRAYNLGVQGRTQSDDGQQIHRQRELERVVGEYLRLHKSLKRLRKKMRA